MITKFSLTMIRNSHYLAVFFLLFFSSFVLAQPGPTWFQSNDRGNHFEGSYSKKVSNPSVSLVSLLGNTVNYSFGQDQALDVQFFSDEKQAYELHAEELRITQFYWMQDKNTMAAKGWNSFNTWKVDYLLKKLSIDSRNLALLVQVGEKGKRKFLPAYVSMNGESQGSSRYIAQIRLGRAASTGSYSIYKGTDRVKEKLIKEQGITDKPAGIVFPLVIAKEELGNEPMWITVEINLKEKNTLDPFTYSFSFFHQPNK